MGDIDIVEFDNQFSSNEIKDFILSTLSEAGLPDLEDYESLDDLNDIKEGYEDRGNFFVAVQNGKIVGTVGIMPAEKDSEKIARLKRMYVLKELQGKGIAKELLDTALNFAKEKGYEKVILNTDINMKRAHRFYEKNGFKRTAEGTQTFFYELNLN